MNAKSFAIRPLTIRLSRRGDERSLQRLAALDSKRPPSGRVLLAEVDRELWAAVGVDDGRAVADPFRPSGDVLEMLRMRAAMSSRLV
jgi:hypothetical protein